MFNTRSKQGLLLSAAFAVHCGAPQPTQDAAADSAADANVVTEASVADAAAAEASAPDAAAEGGVSHEGEVTRGRLVVADGRAATVQVWDLDTRTRVGMFSVTGPASAYGEREGTDGVGYLVQRAQNRTDVLSSGIVFHLHDTHYHLVKSAPTVLANRALTTMMPTHLSSHDGWSALFNDGDGTVTFMNDAQMLTGSPMLRTFSTGVAHHGAAMVAYGHLLSTIPDPMEPAMGATRLPVGLSWRDRANTMMEAGRAVGCPALHGNALGRNSAAAGCADGVLVLRWDSAMLRFTSQKIANPMDAPPSTRVGTLVGHHSLPVFIGNWGSQPAITIVDPAANGGAGSITPVLLPARPLGFALDSEGEKLFVLTLDGRLHRLNPTTGAADGAPLMAIPAYEMIPSGEGAVRPSIAVTGDRLYVNDPRDGTVREVDLEAWALGMPLMVGGAPASIRVLSMSPDFHAHEGHMH